ncbi:MAG: NUDIX hydrolase [Candidatus Latescibacterota bacterium]|nr:NUDIX hydrolase [Candidatus Latescibacterota bacterium]
MGDFKVFSVRRDRRRSPRTGTEHDFHILEMPEWINVIPVTRAGNVVVIHQYRHGTEEGSLEIPGGVAEPEDGSLAEAARRELLEETGFSAEEILRIGHVAANPAIQTNRLHTFVALGAHKIQELTQEAGEDIAVDEVPMESISNLISSGQIDHALVVAGLYWFEQFRQCQPEVLERYVD